MTDEIRYLFAMACVLPALVGFCLYKKMQPQYHLLIYMMLMDAVTETIVFIGKKSTSFEPVATIWSNGYVIINLGLFLAFVKRNGYIKKQLQQILIAVAVIVAIFTYYKIGSFLKDLYFLICFMYAAKLFIVIDILSKQVTVVNTKLMHNFWFWASALFVVQSAYGLLTFGIYLFSLEGTSYGENIATLHRSVNVIYYCLFSVVLLLVPKRNRGFLHQIS